MAGTTPLTTVSEASTVGFASPAWRPADTTDVLTEALLYKATANSDLVVLRKVSLYADHFVSYHDHVREPENTKNWHLDRHCELHPKSASDLKLKQKYVRPKGTWTVTATLFAAQQQVKVYEFEVEWPKSWAPTGYTSFSFGFEDLAMAQKWHEILQGCICKLGEQRKARHSRTQSTVSEPPEPVYNPSATGPSRPHMLPMEEPQVARVFSEEDIYHDPESELELEEECLEETPTEDREKWVPYRQTNGIAIYRHQEEGGSETGGEFMVSCVVRGSPRECLNVLMRQRANTTVLGPANRVQVLQPKSENGTTEVLRIVLAAPGYAGYFCAPREMIVERMVKQSEEEGVFVVMFQSCELPHESTSSDGASERYGRGLFKRPVRGTVQGGYTIAGLHGYSRETSPETLVTCILKVGLGGCLSESNPFRPFSNLFGWTDNFQDRLLMGVHLLRDEVEQKRFMVRPFSLVSSIKNKISEEPEQGVPAAAMPAESFSHVASIRRQHSATSSPSQRIGRMTSSRHPALAHVMSPPSQTSTRAPAIEDALAAGEGAPMDLEAMRARSTLPTKFWKDIHVPGGDAPFSVRGPTYLKDKRKVPGGVAQFQLGSLDLVVLPGRPLQHVARYLPSIKQSGAPFSIILNLVVPGSPMLSMVAAFVCDKHPRILGKPPANPMEDTHDWQAFDFVLHKFVYGDDETRNKMLKLIPHIAEGSWMIKQSVGTTPVILGKALKTTYHITPQYMEVDVDISANSVANYVTGLVRGATKSLAIDMGIVLEGTAPWELPEALLGCFRLTHLDCGAAVPLDTNAAA